MSRILKTPILSAQEELLASRTGNFVTMKFDGSDLKMDLLLGLER